MPAALSPGNEAERLAALLSLNIIGTQPTIHFDIFPELASRLFASPIAAVSLVEEHRQWFKASVGLDVSETPRDVSFCAHAILNPDEVLYVPDATKDPRFADNALVTGDFGLRFYAGAPILGPTGAVVGALCVLDRKAQAATPEQLAQLKTLAIGVGSALKLHSEMDIARKREVEHAMIHTMLASVFQKVDAAVVVVRANGTFLLGNPAFHSLVGYSADELQKMSVRNITLRENDAVLSAAHERQLMTGQPYTMDVITVAKDGSHVPTRLCSALAKGADQQAFRVVTLQKVTAAPVLETVWQPTQAVLGCIQFLGLEKVREAYGPRWERMRSKLLQAAEHVLKRNLSEADVYSRTADDAFSIWFKNGTEDDNAALVARVGREIRLMLLSELGEQTSCSVGSYTQVTEMADGTAPTPGVMDGFSARLAERRREAEQQARELISQVIEQQPRELTPVSSASGRAMQASYVDLPRALRGRLAAAMSLVGGPGADIDTEMLRLGLAAEAILQDIAQGAERLYFITVPAGLLLGSQGRDRLIAHWKSFGPAVGSRLVTMLAEIPADVRHASLAEAAWLLRSVTKGVGVVIEDIDNLPFDLQTCPFSIVALPSVLFAGHLDAKLRDFINKMHQIKARVLIRLRPVESPQRWQSLGADLTTVA